MLVIKRNQEKAQISVPVTVEPRKGFTDQQVVDKLSDQAATEIDVVAPGFISAQLPATSFKAIEQCAFVHEKKRSK